MLARAQLKKSKNFGGEQSLRKGQKPKKGVARRATSPGGMSLRGSAQGPELGEASGFGRRNSKLGRGRSVREKGGKGEANTKEKHDYEAKEQSASSLKTAPQGRASRQTRAKSAAPKPDVTRDQGSKAFGRRKRAGGKSAQMGDNGGVGAAFGEYSQSGLSEQISNYSALISEICVENSIQREKARAKFVHVEGLGGDPEGFARGSESYLQAIMQRTRFCHDVELESGRDFDAHFDEGKVGQNVVQGSSSTESKSEDIGAMPELVLPTHALDEERRYAESLCEESCGIVDGQFCNLELGIVPRGFEDCCATASAPRLGAPEFAARRVGKKAQVDGFDQEARELLDQSDDAAKMRSLVRGSAERVERARQERELEIAGACVRSGESMLAAKQSANVEERDIIELSEQKLANLSASDRVRFEIEAQALRVEDLTCNDWERRRALEERQKSQSLIESSYLTKLNKEREAQEKAQKEEEQSVLGRAGEVLEEAIDAVARALKAAMAEIARMFRELCCAVQLGYAKFLYTQDKEASKRALRSYYKWKSFVMRVEQKVVQAFNEVVDELGKKVKKVMQKTMAYLDNLAAALGDIMQACYDVYQKIENREILSIWDGLEALGDVFLSVIKVSLRLLGIDVDAFVEKMLLIGQAIVDDAGGYFSVLGGGIGDGFVNFGKNIGENAKAMFSNLWNLWLGAAGVMCPGDFSMASLVKLGVELAGIDMGEVMEGCVERRQKIEQEALLNHEEREMRAQRCFAVEEKGIWDTFVEFLGDFSSEIMEAAIAAVATEAAKAGVKKIVALCNPISGILAVLESAWDLFQFVRTNLTALGDFMSTITEALAQAAKGSCTLVASMVETSLCQLIPLLIDLLLRLVGLNVGAAMKGVLDKLRKKIKGVFLRVVNKFKGEKSQTEDMPQANLDSTSDMYMVTPDEGGYKLTQKTTLPDTTPAPVQSDTAASGAQKMMLQPTIPRPPSKSRVIGKKLHQRAEQIADIQKPLQDFQKSAPFRFSVVSKNFKDIAEAQADLKKIEEDLCTGKISQKQARKKRLEAQKALRDAKLGSFGLDLQKVKALNKKEEALFHISSTGNGDVHYSRQPGDQIQMDKEEAATSKLQVNFVLPGQTTQSISNQKSPVLRETGPVHYTQSVGAAHITTPSTHKKSTGSLEDSTPQNRPASSHQDAYGP